jgi:hypothetical protein
MCESHIEMEAQMPATVKGGLWPTNGVDVLTTAHTSSAGRHQAARALSQKQNLALRELTRWLVIGVPGGNINKTYARVVAAEELGGVRPIEQEVLINRASTNDDITDIVADLTTLSVRTTFGANPPPNLDGNPLGTR